MNQSDRERFLYIHINVRSVCTKLSALKNNEVPKIFRYLYVQIVQKDNFDISYAYRVQKHPYVRVYYSKWVMWEE